MDENTQNQEQANEAVNPEGVEAGAEQAEAPATPEAEQPAEGEQVAA